MSQPEVFDEGVHAVRMGELLIDEDSGEILSEHDVGVDTLAFQLKDAMEQCKVWEQTATILKRAIGRKLDLDHARAAETPHGTARWVVQQRRSAKAQAFIEAAEEFGLDDDTARRIVIMAARDLDPKVLESEVAGAEAIHGDDGIMARAVRQAVEATIEQKTVAYVQLQPLRKAAPSLERETL